MTTEERKKMHESIYSGLRMMVEKLEKVAREKQSWSLEELGYVADIMKDISKTEKCLVKTNWMLSEHSEEKY